MKNFGSILLSIAVLTGTGASASAQGAASEADATCLGCVEDQIYNEIQRGKIEAAMNTHLVLMQEEMRNQIDEMMKIQDDIGYEEPDSGGRLSALGQLIDLAETKLDEGAARGTAPALRKAQIEIKRLHSQALTISKKRVAASE